MLPLCSCHKPVHASPRFATREWLAPPFARHHAMKPLSSDHGLTLHRGAKIYKSEKNPKKKKKSKPDDAASRYMTTTGAATAALDQKARQAAAASAIAATGRRMNNNVACFLGESLFRIFSSKVCPIPSRSFRGWLPWCSGARMTLQASFSGRYLTNSVLTRGSFTDEPHGTADRWA